MKKLLFFLFFVVLPVYSWAFLPDAPGIPATQNSDGSWTPSAPVNLPSGSTGLTGTSSNGQFLYNNNGAVAGSFGTAKDLCQNGCACNASFPTTGASAYIDSGSATDDASKVNALLSGGGHWYASKSIAVGTALTIPSNTWLELSPNVWIVPTATFEASAGGNLLQNYASIPANKVKTMSVTNVAVGSAGIVLTASTSWDSINDPGRTVCVPGIGADGASGQSMCSVIVSTNTTSATLAYTGLSVGWMSTVIVAANPYATLTLNTDGYDITTASASGAGTYQATMTISNLTSGKTYTWSFTPSGTGQVPTITATSGAGSPTIPTVVFGSAETITFTASATSAVFQFANSTTTSWGTGSTMSLSTSLTAASPVINRDYDIWITGAPGSGISEGNMLTPPGGSIIYLAHIDKVNINNLTAYHLLPAYPTASYAPLISDATDVRVEWLTLGTMNGYCRVPFWGNGPHIVGPAQNIYIGHLRGTTNDDFAAITAADYATNLWQSAGDVSNVTWEDLQPNIDPVCSGSYQTGNGLTIDAGAGSKATHITVRNIGGRTMGNGVYLNEDPVGAGTTNSWVDDILLENIHPTLINPSSNSLVRLESVLGQNITMRGVGTSGLISSAPIYVSGNWSGSILIDNAGVDMPYAGSYPYLVAVKPPTSGTTTVNSIVINNAKVIRSGSDYGDVLYVGGSSTVVNRAEINNPVYDSIYASPSVGGILNVAGGTVKTAIIKGAQTQNLFALVQATGTINYLGIYNSTIAGYSYANNALFNAGNGSSIGYTNINGVQVNNSSTVIELASGSSAPMISLSNYQITNSAQFLDANTTTNLFLGPGFFKTSRSYPIVVRNGGAVTEYGTGNVLDNVSRGYDGVLLQGTGTFTGSDLSFPVDVAKVTNPIKGIMFYNTNAATSPPGNVGPAIYTGSAWETLWH